MKRDRHHKLSNRSLLFSRSQPNFLLDRFKRLDYKSDVLIKFDAKFLNTLIDIFAID